MCVHIKVILDQKQKGFCNLPPLSKCCYSNSMTKPIWLFQFPFLGSCPLSIACKISMISLPRTRYVTSVSVQCSDQFRLKKVIIIQKNMHTKFYFTEMVLLTFWLQLYKVWGSNIRENFLLPYSPNITVTQESQHSTSTIPLHITQPSPPPPPPPPFKNLFPLNQSLKNPSHSPCLTIHSHCMNKNNTKLELTLCLSQASRMEALWNLHRELRGSLAMARPSVISAWSVFFWACCAWNSPQCQQAGQQQHNTHLCGGPENNHSISDNKLDGRISKTQSASDKTDFSKVRSFVQEKHGKSPEHTLNTPEDKRLQTKWHLIKVNQ